MVNFGAFKRVSRNKLLETRGGRLGFVVGGSVRVISELNGDLIVNIKESRVAISRGMANRIMV